MEMIPSYRINSLLIRCILIVKRAVKQYVIQISSLNIGQCSSLCCIS